MSGEQFTTEVHGTDDVSAGIQHVVAVCDSVARSNAKEMSCEVSFESPSDDSFHEYSEALNCDRSRRPSESVVEEMSREVRFESPTDDSFHNFSEALYCDRARRQCVNDVEILDAVLWSLYFCEPVNCDLEAFESGGEGLVISGRGSLKVVRDRSRVSEGGKERE